MTIKIKFYAVIKEIPHHLPQLLVPVGDEIATLYYILVRYFTTSML